MSGLLYTVHKYRGRKSNTPLENFMTEALCWNLRENKSLRKHFLRWMFDDSTLLAPDSANCIETQKVLQGCIFDVFIEGTDYVAIIENKRGKLDNIDQVVHYEKILNKNIKGKKILVGTLSKWAVGENEKRSLTGPLFDKTWTQLNAWMTQNQARLVKSNQVWGFLMKDFRNLLDELDYAVGIPITKVMTNNKEFLPGLQNTLLDIFRNIRLKNDWSSVYQHLPRSDVTPDGEPLKKPRSVNAIRWTRVGIDLNRVADWYPSLFFGVLYGNDHHTNPYDRPNGLDLSLIVDIDKRRFFGYQKVPEYKTFVKQLTSLAEKSGWELYDHLGEAKPNKWHPIHVRKPLYEVIRDHKDVESQMEAIETQLFYWLNHILGLERNSQVEAFLELRKILIRNAS